ncbi:purine/pyrimidine permease [Bacillus sp. FJAT-47783]|uniref:purine/pyrimidine permease n=1 Tax=Bacillus sp. FJAT-47783 TaxID=2922712 RepID=UPI001FABAAFA|nr:purine/pyrimidine permease [Bacillus sp. FJAT-47783]
MRTALSSIQWMVFMIAGTIVTPIAVAASFGMDAHETAGLIQRTIFVLGLSSLLQVLFGHRYPINEGPAGLWWGVFVIYASLGPTLFGSHEKTLQAIEAGILASGVLFILLSLFGLIEKISKLFTPVVTGVYLLLLVSQLSGSFLNGMLGVGYRKEGVDLHVAGLCFVLIVFTFLLIRKGPAVVRQYAILISLAIGWVLFALFDLAIPIERPNQFIAFPQIFAFGEPVWDTGMIVTSAFITLLLLANLIASIQVVDQVLKNQGIQNGETRYRQAGFMTGINQLLGGFFSAIGCVPISGAAGFIATTKISAKLPFIIGSVLVITMSFFPAITSFFAALPTPVGFATIFTIFASMIGLAFEEFDKVQDAKQARYVIGISLLTGIGAMFVASSAFKGIPPIVTSLLNNGLVLGTVVAIFVDQLTKSRTK